MKTSSIISIVCIILSIFSWFSIHLALADVLSNSLRQRIGDYDIQINTVPSVPILGQETRINVRITTVSNDPIIDTPIMIRISDENKELIRTQPILLSSGHYPFNYVFNRSGVFLFSIDILNNLEIKDSDDSNKQLTFDFPIRVSGAFSAEITTLAIPITIMVSVIGSFIAIMLFKKSRTSKRAV
jgi:hypothetical protein